MELLVEMTTTNSERLRKYRVLMTESGFRRLSFYASKELADLIARERKPSECGGRVLERLLLGESAKRPGYYVREEKSAKRFGH